MDISTLKEGDKMAGPALFPGMCLGGVELTVVSVKRGPTMSAAVFSCKFGTVSMGRVTAYFDGKSVQWGVLS